MYYSTFGMLIESGYEGLSGRRLPLSRCLALVGAYSEALRGRENPLLGSSAVQICMQSSSEVREQMHGLGGIFRGLEGAQEPPPGQFCRADLHAELIRS